MIITFLISALHIAVTETTRECFRNCGSRVKYCTEEFVLYWRVNMVLKS